ncbi:hypothetical protein N7508_008149 [Penicillium antarcticum]|uniref:uncharacterized protein n=1 Tax=Penicillium antarcticum TaxID=416450 RepID=UPI002390E5E7|nr:uncharacterized protein N7508_008149 [Penicillium antarcticum]KAJ5297900.1 hypothetical protein N7508_008149 [Penicillium antarcticum]
MRFIIPTLPLLLALSTTFTIAETIPADWWKKRGLSQFYDNIDGNASYDFDFNYSSIWECQ